MALEVPAQTPLENYLLYRKHIVALVNWLATTSTVLSTDTTGDQIQAISTSLFKFNNDLDAITAVPGLIAFIRIIESKPVDYDVRAEYLTTAALIDTAIDLVKAVNAKALLAGGWDANGMPIWETFTVAQAANFKTAIDNIAASITSA